MANPNPGRSMFGLSRGEPRQAAPGPPAASSGGKALSLLVLLLLAISGINLYRPISARMKSDDALAKHTDELNLLTSRVDSSDERSARLRGQSRVKLGLSRQEVQRARALAADIQKQQQDAMLE